MALTKLRQRFLKFDPEKHTPLLDAILEELDNTLNGGLGSINIGELIGAFIATSKTNPRLVLADNTLTIYDNAGNPIIVVDGDGLHVKDTGGTEKVRLGKLTDSTYGGEVAQSGQQVKFSTLGFGHGYAQVITGQSTSETGSFTDLATPGPSVTATVGNSGRALVIASVGITLSGNNGNSNGYAGILISGASSRAPSFDDGLHHSMNIGTNFSHSSSLSTSILFTGLNTGSTTFKMQYISGSGGGGNHPTFYERFLTVIPF